MSLTCCSSTSDPKTNPYSGTNHPLVKGAQEWPRQAKRAPDDPAGIWFPAHGEVHGTVVCLHGIQTHGGWFSPLAQHLTAAGWNVVAPDRRGSGQNTASPFQRGHAGSAKELLDDLSVTMEQAHKLAPSKPLILIGTSWGSNLAGAYCVDEKTSPKPDALVQLVPATATRYRKTTEILTLLTRKLPFGEVQYLPGEVQCEHSKLAPSPREGEPPSNTAAGKAGPIWQWVETDRKLGLLITEPSRATIWAGRELGNEWTGTAPESLRQPVLLIVAERDQIMNNARAEAAVEKAAKKGRWKIVRLMDGHGIQVSKPGEIAEAILSWERNRWR
jgi:pimeloyl-ACP methyl ester carboxylesterase